MSTSININSLCDDVLLKIFSYLETDVLVFCASEVCVRWMELIKCDSILWMNRWFEWDISQSLITLKNHICKMPLLKSLKLNFSEGSSQSIPCFDLIMEELASINQIRMLHLNFLITSDILPYLNQRLLYLYATNISRQNYNFLVHLNKICSLKLGNAYDFCGRHLRLIADNCPRLKKFSLAQCRSLITADIVYFITKKKNELEVFEINGYGVTDEAFAMLIHCHNLKKLQIHDTRKMSKSTMYRIVEMPNLKVINLYRLEASCLLSIGRCEMEQKRVFFSD